MMAMQAVRSKTVLNIFNRFLHDKRGHFKKGVSLSDGISRGEDLDYLYDEAKTALQKADQIMMTQCKLRQADLDALRLWTMLKDYECRYNGAMMQFENAQKECRRQRDELDTTLCKVKELQQCLKEQTEMIQIQMTRQYEQKKIFEEEKASRHIKDSDKKALLNQLQQMEEDVKLKNKVYETLIESGDELLKNIKEYKKSVEKTRPNFEQKQSNLESALDSIQQKIASLEEKNENSTNEINKKIEDLKQTLIIKTSITSLEEKNKNSTNEINKKIEDLKQQVLDFKHDKEIKEHLKLKDTVMNLVNRFLQDKRGHFKKGIGLSGAISCVFSKLKKQIDKTSLPKDYILFLNVYGSIAGEYFNFCGGAGNQDFTDQISYMVLEQEDFECCFEDDIGEKEMKWCWLIASIKNDVYYYMNLSPAGKGYIYSINDNGKPVYFADNFLEFLDKFFHCYDNDKK